MLFCSQAYLLFFTLIFVVYWAMPWQRARVWLLLVGSFYFYASWNHWLACLICVSTFVDYWLARGMDAGFSPRIRKLFLFINIGGNLSMLCYFKYANFFLDSLQTALHSAGASVSMPMLQVIVPVGISFYTFEAINYGVDVYRRKVKAERSLPNFMLFITFFPHLVAGPIVRARDFLPQIKRPKHWDWARLNHGAQYFLMGLVKKLVIADRMAYYIDPIYANPNGYSTHHHWIALFAYFLQLYGDFSGYSDMAIGSAHMLGYKLAPNFNMPLLADSFADFWQRWHISLSSWLRDYVFNPLGGARRKPWIVWRNMLITFTVSGLWHGANWTFVLWGVVHGLFIVMHHWFHGVAKKRPWLTRALRSKLGIAVCIGLTFLGGCLTGVLFRSPTLDIAGTVYGHLFVPYHGSATSPVHVSGLLYTWLFVIFCHWVAVQPWFKRASIRLPEPVAGLGYATLMSLVLVLAPGNNNAFIYFQF
jgi:alginate O-acetyltransferase complex protein AlgI